MSHGKRCLTKGLPFKDKGKDMLPTEILLKVQSKLDTAGYKYHAVMEETFDEDDIFGDRFLLEIFLDPGVVVESPEKTLKTVSIGLVHDSRGFETVRIIDYGGTNWVCDYPLADPCTQDWNLDEAIQILMRELEWLAAGNKYQGL